MHLHRTAAVLDAARVIQGLALVSLTKPKLKPFPKPMLPPFSVCTCCSAQQYLS